MCVVVVVVVGIFMKYLLFLFPRGHHLKKKNFYSSLNFAYMLVGVCDVL